LTLTSNRNHDLMAYIYDDNVKLFYMFY
jgi:hypothetical protein